MHPILSFFLTVVETSIEAKIEKLGTSTVLRCNNKMAISL